MISTSHFHPMLIHFPIALVAIGFLAEIAALAGEIKELHENFALLTLGILVVVSILRIYLKTKNKEASNIKWIAFSLYGLAAICVSITGFYGGTLVYNYMMPL